MGIGGLYRFGQAGWLIPGIVRATRKLPGNLNVGDIQVHTGLSGRILARMFPFVDMAAYGMPIAGWWPGSVEPELAKERMKRGFDYIPVRVWQEMASWAAADDVPWDTGWQEARVPNLIILGDCDSMLFPSEGQAAYDRSGAEDKTLKVLDDKDGLTHWGHLDIVLGKSSQTMSGPSSTGGWPTARTESIAQAYRSTTKCSSPLSRRASTRQRIRCRRCGHGGREGWPAPAPVRKYGPSSTLVGLMVKSSAPAKSRAHRMRPQQQDS